MNCNPDHPNTNRIIPCDDSFVIPSLLYPEQPLTREKIVDVFARYRGAKAAVTKSTKTSSPQVSKWLAGRMTSARIEDACTSLATRLLANEALERAGFIVKAIVVPRRPGRHMRPPKR